MIRLLGQSTKHPRSRRQKDDSDKGYEYSHDTLESAQFGGEPFLLASVYRKGLEAGVKANHEELVCLPLGRDDGMHVGNGVGA